jgi:hypothetical protein
MLIIGCDFHTRYQAGSRRLTQYVEEQERQVEFMTPHCHLEIAVK